MIPLTETRMHAIAVSGIGPWSSAIYRLSALRRPDAWPAGDLALAVAIADLWRLPAPPSPPETVQRAETWRPWRAVAARLLWHQYLSTARAPRPRRAAGR